MLPMKVSEGGRVVIPAELREKYGIKVGDAVMWQDSDQGLVLVSRRAAIRRIQERVTPYRIPGKSVVDELIAERRAEAERE
jgi:AbrB family looped-hinge helix DNA binding protein